MKDKEKLFVYGTLMDKETQKAVFGRVADGAPEALNGYVKSEIVIEEETLPLIVPNAGGIIKGLVIEVTGGELRKIDEYETEAYKREKVILGSGMPAWVYVENKTSNQFSNL